MKTAYCSRRRRPQASLERAIEESVQCQGRGRPSSCCLETLRVEGFQERKMGGCLSHRHRPLRSSKLRLDLRRQSCPSPSCQFSRDRHKKGQHSHRAKISVWRYEGGTCLSSSSFSYCFLLVLSAIRSSFYLESGKEMKLKI